MNIDRNGNVKIEATKRVEELMHPQNVLSLGSGELENILDAKKAQYIETAHYLNLKSFVAAKEGRLEDASKQDNQRASYIKLVTELDKIEKQLISLELSEKDKTYREAYAIGKIFDMYKELKRDSISSVLDACSHFYAVDYTDELVAFDNIRIVDAYHALERFNTRWPDSGNIIEGYAAFMYGSKLEEHVNELGNVQDKLRRALSRLDSSEKANVAEQYADNNRDNEHRNEDLYNLGILIRNIKSFTPDVIQLLENEKDATSLMLERDESTLDKNEKDDDTYIKEILTVTEMRNREPDSNVVVYTGKPSVVNELYEKFGGIKTDNVWKGENIDVDAVRATIYNCRTKSSEEKSNDINRDEDVR